jgi:RNA-splicing ligase RtcB
MTTINNSIKVFLPEDMIKDIIPSIQKAVDTISDTTNTHRFMSDCHPCHGTTFVGWTFYLNDIFTIKPTYIGPDIGCGILVIPLKNKYNTKKLEKLVAFIKRFFPMGNETMHKQPIVEDSYIDKFINYTNESTNEFTKNNNLEDYEQSLEKLCKKIKVNYNNIKRTIGTLGGGNHYIEMNEDETGCQYLSIHSGSRSLGHHILMYYMKHLDKDGYITPQMAKEYIFDIILGQHFAQMNRHVMANIILNQLNENMEDYIESFHNFLDINMKLLRKGAISAKFDEPCIVSLNMKEGILLCKGLGNMDYNYSCAHGCGRNMARSEVDHTNKKLKEFENIMKDIITVDVNKNTIDEAPFAYRESKLIMDSIKETVIIEKHLRTIMNVKG